MSITQDGVDLRRAVGISITLFVCLLWTVATFLSQYIVTGSAKGPGHRPVDPFYFTFLGTTVLILCLPVLVAKNLLVRQWRRREAADSHPQTLELISQNTDAGLVLDDQSEQHRSLIAALWITPVWFLGNWTYNISMKTTSVTSNTILSQTSSLFTFAFSVWFLSEKYNNRKLVCVFLTVLGVVLVTVKDGETGAGDNANWSLWGDFVCLVAAMVYGLFVVVMRMKVGDEHTANLPLVFGYVGVITTVVGVPILGLLLLTGVYSKADVFLPRTDFLLIYTEGVMDNLLADVLQAQSVLLLGPTLATLGLSFTIPMTAYWEVFQTKPRPAWSSRPGHVLMTVGGTFCILAGFWALNGLEKCEDDEGPGIEGVLEGEQVPLVKGVQVDDRAGRGVGGGLEADSLLGSS